MSKAAGRPLHQLGRNMSAGRDLVPGIRVGPLFEGPVLQIVQLKKGRPG